MSDNDTRSHGSLDVDMPGASPTSRYLLREGHLFGGLTAVTLYQWSVWLFAGWAALMLAAWLWDIWRQP